MNDLQTIAAIFKRLPRGRLNGFDFSGLSTDAVFAEFKGRHGTVLTSVVAGWRVKDGALQFDAIANPTNIGSTGFVYAKDVAAKAELHYMDEDGNAVQITSAGAVVGGGGGGTLDTAYNGGRTIAADSGPVVFTTSGASPSAIDVLCNPAANLGASDNLLDVSFSANALTGVIRAISIDYSGATSFNNASDIAAISLIGATNAGAGECIGLHVLAGWDTGIECEAPVTFLGGPFTFLGGNIDLDPTGTFALDMDAAQTATITIADSLANSFLIREGANVYLDINTTGGTEKITLGNAITNPAITQVGTGAVTLTGDLVFTGGGIDLDPTGIFSMSMDPGGTISFGMADNLNSAFLVTESARPYLSVSTLNGVEAITFGSTSIDPDFLFVGDGPITQSGIGQVSFAGNVNAESGLDVSVAAFTMTGTSIDLDPTGTFALDMDAAQAATITLADMDNGLVIQAAGGEDMIAVSYSAGTKALSLCNATDNPTLTQLGTGQVSFGGNVDAANGLDVSVAAFTFTGTNIDLDPTGTFALDMDAAQTATVTLADALASALLVREGANAYIDITTTNAAEAIALGNAVTNPTLSQLGTGQVSFAGNVDAANGLDVSVAALTFTGTNVDLDPTGTFAVDMDAAQTATFTISDNLASAFKVQEGVNNYIGVSTANAAEVIGLGNPTTNPAITQYGTGAVTLTGPLAFTGANFDLDPTGTFALDMDAAQTATVTLSDNLASAFKVQEGVNAYLDITTSNAAEVVSLGNATTNPALTQLGSGQVTFNGNVDALAGLDVTGNFDFSGYRGGATGQTMMFNNFFPVDTGQWAPASGYMYLDDNAAAGRATKVLCIQMPGLKVGDTIVKWRLLGSVEASGDVANVVVNAKLRRVTKNAAGAPNAPLVSDVTDGAIAAVDTNADQALDQEATPSALNIVLDDYQYFVEITGTTPAFAGNLAYVTGIEADIQRK